MSAKTVRTIAPTRTPMPEADPVERARSFGEVALGYTLEQALAEADRCLDCTDPTCVRGCPVAVDIPAFVRLLSTGDLRGAYDVVRDANLLPSICGRVCPQEEQCEVACTVAADVEAVAIGRLERFVGDQALDAGWGAGEPAPPSGFRVAVVGSGPAGLTAAADLALAGCEVVVYEALHAAGGVLRYGIPSFRLPRQVLDAELARLERLGVRIECNTVVGRLFTLEELLDVDGFDAVFVATGAGAPVFLGIPGENLNGVVSANELLTRVNLLGADRFPAFDTPLGLGRHVVVLGAGNTAMDALRVAKRLGAESVTCVYRRTRAEAPARAEELHHAEQEGIDFRWLAAPVEILGDADGRVRGLRCQAMELGEPDSSGRRRPVPIPGETFEVPCDLVVYALGTSANPVIGRTSAIKLNRWGYLDTDDDLATSLAGVWAGGDIVTGAATVILAMGAGRRAARSIKRYLGLHDDTGPGPADAEAVFGIDPARARHVRVRDLHGLADPAMADRSAAGLAVPGDEPAHTPSVPLSLRRLVDLDRIHHDFPLALVPPGTNGDRATTPVLVPRALRPDVGGRDTPCDEQAAARIVDHVWHRWHDERRDHRRDTLRPLAEALAERLRAAEARVDTVGVARALGLGGGKPGNVDPGALAAHMALVQDRRREVPVEQRETWRRARDVIAAAVEAAGRTPDPAPTLSEARQEARSAAAEARTLAVALAVALTTVPGDAAGRGPAGAVAENSPAAPEGVEEAARLLAEPVLVHVDARDLDDGALGALVATLSGAEPVKIVLHVRDDLDHGAALARSVAGLGTAAVVALPVSHLPRGLDAVREVLAFPGPGLVCVASPDPAHLLAGVPVYLAAAAAHAGRVFPSWSFVPGRDTPWRLVADPQPERGRPRTDVVVETAERTLATHTVEVSALDAAALDVRWAAHLHLDPAGPLALVRDGVVVRAAPDASLARHLAAVDAAWADLQRLCGVTRPGRPRPEREEPPPPAEPESGAAAYETSAEALGEPGDLEVIEGAPAPGEAWVDSPRCTTCGECVAVNPHLFAYDENNQAQVADREAGTYRDLVEAAEHCKVAVVHPGEPTPADAEDFDDDELADLRRRAEAFR